MKGPVVVTGASGFIGSWLVMKLLKAGYIVRATVRDPSNQKKTKPLLDLPGSSERLSLWKADLSEPGSFDEVIKGCTGVFHVATHIDFESKDPENDVIKPTVEGMVGILKSCKEAGTVKRVVFTSSAGAVCAEEHMKPVYDETCWSDVEFCRRVKITGWMYFVSKTLAEKAALKYAEENGIDLVTIISPLVMGPFLSTGLPPSFHTSLALITGTESHYMILKNIQFIHLDDLCESHIFLFENPEAKGRYICSSHDTNIYDLARMLQKRYPEYNIQQEFEWKEEDLPAIHFSSKKLLCLGFKFNYTMEEMFDQAIQTCRERKLVPLSTKDESKE